MTRQEAKEYIIKHCNPHRGTGTEWDDAMECAIKSLEQPERKSGYWHDRYVESMGMVATVCSECGYPCSQIPVKYCANCGADMRVADDERPD